MKIAITPVRKLITLGSARSNTKAGIDGNKHEPLMGGRYQG